MTDTLGDMQSRIADEIARTDLTSQITLAITTAIAKWQREQFYFSQHLGTALFSTVAAQEFYTVADAADIPNIAHIDKMTVLISGNRYFMNGRTEQYIEDVSISPTNYGQPVDYSYYAKRIRMYPIPDSAYPVNVAGTFMLGVPAAASASNAWTTAVDGEALIRCEAKMDLYKNYLMDDEMAQSMNKLIYGDPMMPESRGYYRDLKAETARRSATNRVRPTNF